MDLETITDNLNSDVYSSEAEFYTDIDLIIQVLRGDRGGKPTEGGAGAVMTVDGVWGVSDLVIVIDGDWGCSVFSLKFVYSTELSEVQYA